MERKQPKNPIGRRAKLAGAPRQARPEPKPEPKPEPTPEPQAPPEPEPEPVPVRQPEGGKRKRGRG